MADIPKPSQRYIDVEYKVDHARTHVHAALAALADRDTTREWAADAP